MEVRHTSSFSRRGSQWRRDAGHVPTGFQSVQEASLNVSIGVRGKDNLVFSTDILLLVDEVSISVRDLFDDGECVFERTGTGSRREGERTMHACTSFDRNDKTQSIRANESGTYRHIHMLVGSVRYGKLAHDQDVLAKV